MAIVSRPTVSHIPLRANFVDNTANLGTAEIHFTLKRSIPPESITQCRILMTCHYHRYFEFEPFFEILYELNTRDIVALNAQGASITIRFDLTIIQDDVNRQRDLAPPNLTLRAFITPSPSEHDRPSHFMAVHKFRTNILHIPKGTLHRLPSKKSAKKSVKKNINVNEEKRPAIKKVAAKKKIVKK